MTIDTNHFKNLLEAEKEKLTADLSEIARPNPTNPGDWDTVPGDSEEISMREEVADRLEDNEEREATEQTLEARLDEVNLALEKMATDDYGHCEICHMEIETDRLEANPAAATCKAHLEG